MEVIEYIEDSRDFVTVYKKDYFEKEGKKVTRYKPLPKFPPSLNILNGPYKQHLNTQLENRSLPENERSEDPVNNLNRIRDEFPRLRNALPEIVPDENAIKREKEKSMKTIYQLDYSKKLEKDRFHREIMLPQDWIIPETTQRHAYRNPWVIATRELITSSKKFEPRNNLDPNHKEREILCVTTGNSEYTGTIGTAGERIMLRSPSDMKERIRWQNSLSPTISESECSLTLKQNLALPTKIF